MYECMSDIKVVLSSIPKNFKGEARIIKHQCFQFINCGGAHHEVADN